MKRIIALVILGMICGAVMMNIYLSARIDELYLDRETLKVDLYETEERLKKIEAQWQSHRELVIKDVEVEFDQTKRDTFLEVKLRADIAKVTQDLIGEELETIPHTLVVHLIDQRIVDVEGKRYRLQVRTVVLAEKLTYVLRYAQQVELNDDEP